MREPIERLFMRWDGFETAPGEPLRRTVRTSDGVEVGLDKEEVRALGMPLSRFLSPPAKIQDPACRGCPRSKIQSSESTQDPRSTLSAALEIQDPVRHVKFS